MHAFSTCKICVIKINSVHVEQCMQIGSVFPEVQTETAAVILFCQQNQRRLVFLLDQHIAVLKPLIKRLTFKERQSQLKIQAGVLLHKHITVPCSVLLNKAKHRVRLLLGSGDKNTFLPPNIC